ncbi:MAG: hypothetical protein AAF541_06410 [Pseudomonadota bacterium]
MKRFIGKVRGALFFSWSIALLSIPLSMSAAAADEAVPRIATVTPVAYALSLALLDGTGVQVDYLPPKRLPVNRVASWLRKNRSNKYEVYDALVSISDAVPKFAFSNTLRQSNIRLVTIDIAYARLPEGEKVVLSNPEEFFWLNSNNLLLMSGVLKRDFNLLWPEYLEIVNKNYQTLSATVRKLNLEIENLLYAQDIAVFVMDKPALQPIAGSLSMDVMRQDEALALEIPALRVISAASRTRQDKPTDPPGGLLSWRIDDLSRFSEAPIQDRLATNLQSLRLLFE